MIQETCDYFDAMYRSSDDPYGLRDRWYEQRKRELLLATLPARQFTHAFEPGRGVGEMTTRLAARCDHVLASDMSTRAVALARERCAALRNVTVQRQVLPDDWPPGTFDLIVLSEVGYFLDTKAVQTLAACCRAALSAEGTLIACDWLPAFTQRATATCEVHALLDGLGLARLARHEEDDFLLQAWSGDVRSVAQREGIR